MSRILLLSAFISLLVCIANAATLGNSLECLLINDVLSLLRDKSVSASATSYCSSLLSIPLATVSTTSTKTVAPAVSTFITTSTYTPVAITNTATATSTPPDASTTTTSVTTPAISVVTSTSTVTTTVTTSSTVFPAVTVAPKEKRNSPSPVPKPSCFNGKASSVISQACSCLSITKSTTTASFTSTTSLSAVSTTSTAVVSLAAATSLATTTSVLAVATDTVTVFSTAPVPLTTTTTTITTTSTSVMRFFGTAPACMPDTISQSPVNYLEINKLTAAAGTLQAEGPGWPVNNQYDCCSACLANSLCSAFLWANFDTVSYWGSPWVTYPATMNFQCGLSVQYFNDPGSCSYSDIIYVPGSGGPGAGETTYFGRGTCFSGGSA